ncbi:MAG: hypothetical protein C0598_01995 [Marinilabiliales bacterium]|nr:MAG: hypothetical protein C0598_01995 [Marinilabiliales bacterium]
MTAPNNKLSTANFWIITINSSAAFIIAYLLVFYVSMGVTILSTAMFDFNVSFDYSQVYYQIQDYKWTHDSVKLIFSAGPIMVFILGIISLVGFFGLREEMSRLKLLFLWVTLISFNQTFGNLMIGNIFKTGVGHVFNWMYFSDTAKMVVALIGFFGLVTTAFIMRQPVGESGNIYFNKLDENNFPFFIISQIILPFVVGYGLILAYFSQSLLFQERFAWISLSVMLLFIFISLNRSDSMYFDEEERSITYSKFLIIFAVILYVGLRFFLREQVYIQW